MCKIKLESNWEKNIPVLARFSDSNPLKFKKEKKKRKKKRRKNVKNPKINIKI